MSAMPQLTDALVRVGRMESRVATATEDGTSILDLWGKSGSTTGGAARSAPSTVARRAASADSEAGVCPPSKTRGSGGAGPWQLHAVCATTQGSLRNITGLRASAAGCLLAVIRCE